ncbi:MAG TPA: FAD-dependent oxidoreductase [Thermoplasmata archaeon]|nr:FAD-dependent oxidoreductase [Thermoplasmata archaeon]
MTADGVVAGASPASPAAKPPAVAPTAPAAPKVPPKLNPIRVPIAETPVQVRIENFEEVLHAYSKEDAVLEAKRCIQCRRPWCVEACPISQDAREYIRLIAENDFDGAARVTLQDDPLATSLCKVCYHYCEDACVVKKKGVPVAIRHLKRAAMELGNADLAYVASAPKHQRIAVVGAGPAGIMAAWELGIRGYGVTVFEQEPVYGGLMQTIPAYRMTDADVEEDRARLRDLDVTFLKDRKIGADFSPEKLLEEGYQAVFLSVGTSLHRTLGVEGENLPGVLPALALLKRVNRGEPVTLGQKIIVIGGGDVAMDSIRSALRLSHGGHVSLYYRRSREEMPADPEEVHGALAEGIEFVFQKAPLKIVGTDRAEGVVFQSMALGPPDAGGRRSPVPVPGSETTVPCDTVIVAVGQKADLAGFSKSLDLKLTSQGWPEGKSPGFETAIPGVFAAGGRSVVYAMGTATDAAIAIDAYLAGKRGETPTPRPDPFGGSTTFHLPAGYTTPIRV